MSNRVDLAIPIKPHLARYINKQLALENQAAAENSTPIHISHRQALGTFICGLLEPARTPPLKVKGPHIIVSVPVQDCYGRAYDSRYSFVRIRETNIRRLNDFFEFMMNKELFDRLQVLEGRGENKRKSGKIKDEINLFIENYSSEEQELTYERLKKAYYRHKKNGQLILNQVI